MHGWAIFPTDSTCGRRTPALPADLAWFFAEDRITCPGFHSLVEVKQEQLGQLVEALLDLYTTASQYINFT